MSARTISALMNGKMVEVEKPINPNNNNFVIVCDRGDWSGFMNYEECQKRYPGLEKMGRANGYFWVEER